MAGVVGHARVDQAARAMAFVLRWNAHIERTAGRTADDFHGLIGIAPRRHRPEHVELAGRIDIVVHHHDEPSVVGAAERLRREKKRLT